MADLLSSQWFEDLNATLRAAGPVPLSSSRVYRVVLEITGGPTSSPHAITFTLSPEGASVEPGDHLADAVIRLAFDDVAALTDGTRDSATALREGRIKIRGDVRALVPLLEWLQRAHPGSLNS